jgi:hypothetical protein
MDPRPNIGLGAIDTVDQVLVEWPDGNIETLVNVPTNQTLILEQKNGSPKNGSDVKSMKRNAPLFDVGEITEVKHAENEFVDFDRDPLIYHMLSTEGPKISKGDVNADGLEDVYIGGAKDQSGSLLIQKSDGSFERSNVITFESDKASEDMGSVFFDADQDGDLDLYVCSGGNEFSNTSTALIDRLYINDGKGNFKKSNQVLPTGKFESSSTVQAADYDGDGDQDLFVGIRLEAFFYGQPMNGYILGNDGTGKFEDVTATVAPELVGIGMITDALWADVDGDADNDLLIVGEYMPVSVFINDKGTLTNATTKNGLANSNGWWNAIEGGDLDRDGDVDFVVGNHGLNSRFRASVEKPVCMYVNDFDQNGTVEQIVCAYNGSKSYPLALRHDLVKQIPSLKKKYLKYENFRDQTITDIFSPEVVERATKLDAYELATSALINDGKGKFSIVHLPFEAQMAPTYGIEILDINDDGINDILLGGNLYNAKPEIGRYDASFGTLLLGGAGLNFKPVPPAASGLKMDGEVRDITTLTVNGTAVILAARNNDTVLVFKKKRSDPPL